MTTTLPATLPILPENPTWAQKVRYVVHLWDSPFCYHVDDDPRDCGFPEDIGEALYENAERLTKDLTPTDWRELWDIYFVDPSERGAV